MNECYNICDVRVVYILIIISLIVIFVTLVYIKNKEMEVED